MGEYLLRTNALTKEFGRHKAVNKVNLHVKKGSIYGFIGRNGAGKTTCMRMISGLAEPTSGEIELFGYKNQDLKKVRSRISCLIEAPGLYGNMSAYDNLAIKCKLFGMDEKNYIETILDIVGLSKVGKKKAKHFSLGMKQRLGIGLALVGKLFGMDEKNYIETILDIVGLSKVGKKKAKHFSLGMKQRLGIGLALVGEPDLLVLDEPINGLDPQGIAEIRDTILRLKEEHNMTILISSHILEELSKIATHYGIIHNGSLLQELTREELLQRIVQDCYPLRYYP